MDTVTWTEDLHAARRGEPAALERVLKRSRQDLRRYAEYHCPINDVEDAVQESLFTDPPAFIDEFSVHDSDLPGGTAERPQRDGEPGPRRGPEGHHVAGLRAS